jgi:succinate dehydrogenase / fumarate reductase flavoprotein subunit
MELETRKPIVTKIPLPTGKKENVIEYFLDKDLQYKG